MLNLPSWPDKDPEDVLDYEMSFERAFPPNDPLTSVSWALVPPGLTIHSQGFDGRTAVIKLGGGIPGATYRLTATGNTNQRTAQRSVTLSIIEM